MADEHQEVLDARVKVLRDAADQLEAVRGQAPEQVDQAIVDTQSCCNTCTAVSTLPPCHSTCIKVSPLV